MSAGGGPYVQRVLKYPVKIADTFQLFMVPGSRVVHVDVQNGVPVMWAIVPTGDASQELRTFHVRGTGHGIEDGLRYLGSLQLHDGAFVGHLFEPIEGAIPHTVAEGGPDPKQFGKQFAKQSTQQEVRADA
jgi:hypothetical protein